MIILKVMGGLGNQMFEVAYARSLSLEFKEDIYLDTSAYNNYKIRGFSIPHLNISNSLKYIDDIEISNINRVYLKSSQKAYHVYQKVVRELTGRDRFGKGPFKVLSTIGLYYNFDRYYYETLTNNSKIKCLYGYFQSEKYFEKYKEQIAEELRVKTPPTDKEKKLIEEINSCNAVAVSMRLGDDYMKSSSLNVCTEDFYYKGMDHIYNNHKDAVFYIFSDSIERAKEQFNFKFPVRYIEGFSDYESLRLLYSCKHFVISNSSFSWWGSYLAENPNKIVVAPNKWYKDTKEKPDIFLENMVLIEV
ncbi:alpha-1,2-fucosyltransferase [Cytobacillus oceanisediminis]|uniref:alpha-1,2-fucosyltransferase n=1 Tax=Cytobacillus oceanisediminis TaxID=665099 RepID=UPI0024946E5A|nr:alpha-1,2-fucosyltransferase [Cytobacillus oceanisediminis]